MMDSRQMRYSTTAAAGLLAIMAAVFSGPAAGEVKRLDPERFIAVVAVYPRKVIADCRSPQDFEVFRFIDSINVQIENLDERHSRLAGRTIFIVCYFGTKSLELGRALLDRGHGSVYSLEGGIMGLLPFMAENRDKSPELVSRLRRMLTITAPLPGLVAPDFTLTDQDGNQRKLSEFKGGPAVVFFGDPSSGTLARAVEVVVSAARDGSDVQVIVALGGEAARAARVVYDRMNRDLDRITVLQDPRRRAAAAYGLDGADGLVYLDDEGALWLLERGNLDAPLFYYEGKSANELLAAALAGESVPFPESPLFGTVKTPESLEGAPAPGFVLADIRGGEYSPADFRGKPLALFFWTMQCPYSRRQMEFLAASYQGLDEEQYAVIAVGRPPAAGQTAARDQFIEALDPAFPVVDDLDDSVWQGYFVSSVPTTVIIDARGLVAGAVIGMDPELAAKIMAVAGD